MDEAYDYWPRVIRTLRRRENMTQQALADRLGVDQTSVSRWERGTDLPALRQRRKLRDMSRHHAGFRQDQITRARVRNAFWPSSLVGPGAVFIEINTRALSEIGLTVTDLRGRSIYGLFGPQVDDVTERWEHTGIFDGDLAMTISLNRIERPEGPVYIKTLDTPHFTTDGEIWCLCEIQRITADQHAALRAEFGSDNFTLSFDALPA